MNDPLLLAVDLVRLGRASTRLGLVQETGLGRRCVGQAVDDARRLGLLEDADGRLRFPNEKARLAVVVVGALHLGYALTDLSGAVLASGREGWDSSAGPVASLGHAFSSLDALLARDRSPLWGIAVGVPGSAWTGFDVRAAAERYGAPAWVCDETELKALGASGRLSDAAPGVLYVNVGTQIRAALARGDEARRAARRIELGHTPAPCGSDAPCRCRRVGCLEAVAGGWALVRVAEAAAREGLSGFLRGRLDGAGGLTPGDIADAADREDPTSIGLIEHAAGLLGEAIADAVGGLRPSVVAVGGSLGGTSVRLLSAIRRAVYSRPLPLDASEVQIVSAPDAFGDDFSGGANVLIGELFRRETMSMWIRRGTPLHADRQRLYEPAPSWEEA